MAGIFRTAAKEAVRELILEKGGASRFGVTLTDDDIDAVSDKIVDLFETTIALRLQVRERLGGGGGQADSQQPSPKPTSTVPPRRQQINPVHSQEGLERERYQSGFSDREVALPPHIDFKLPRKKVSISNTEIEKLRS